MQTPISHRARTASETATSDDSTHTTDVAFRRYDRGVAGSPVTSNLQRNPQNPSEMPAGLSDREGRVASTASGRIPRKTSSEWSTDSPRFDDIDPDPEDLEFSVLDDKASDAEPGSVSNYYQIVVGQVGSSGAPTQSEKKNFIDLDPDPVVRGSSRFIARSESRSRSASRSQRSNSVVQFEEEVHIIPSVTVTSARFPSSSPSTGSGPVGPRCRYHGSVLQSDHEPMHHDSSRGGSVLQSDRDDPTPRSSRSDSLVLEILEVDLCQDVPATPSFDEAERLLFETSTLEPSFDKHSLNPPENVSELRPTFDKNDMAAARMFRGMVRTDQDGHVKPTQVAQPRGIIAKQLPPRHHRIAAAAQAFACRTVGQRHNPLTPRTPRQNRLISQGVQIPTAQRPTPKSQRFPNIPDGIRGGGHMGGQPIDLPRTPRTPRDVRTPKANRRFDIIPRREPPSQVHPARSGLYPCLQCNLNFDSREGWWRHVTKARCGFIYGRLRCCACGVKNDPFISHAPRYYYRVPGKVNRYICDRCKHGRNAMGIKPTELDAERKMHKGDRVSSTTTGKMGHIVGFDQDNDPKVIWDTGRETVERRKHIHVEAPAWALKDSTRSRSRSSTQEPILDIDGKPIVMPMGMQATLRHTLRSNEDLEHKVSALEAKLSEFADDRCCAGPRCRGCSIM